MRLAEMSWLGTPVSSARCLMDRLFGFDPLRYSIQAKGSFLSGTDLADARAAGYRTIRCGGFPSATVP